MSARTISFPGFTIAVDRAWDDVTDSAEDRDQPYTVADRNDGDGALQFSHAIYRSGNDPGVTAGDLDAMLGELATARRLGDPFELARLVASTIVVAASFHAENDFVRVWYLSNGRNVLLPTYVCEWNVRRNESDTVEKIVRSVRFES